MENAGKVLFSDDFSSYPPAEILDSGYLRRLRGRGIPGGKSTPYHLDPDDGMLGPWKQTTLHYSWHSERIPNRMFCTLPWRIVDRDRARWLEQPESFFNAVLQAGDAGWRDYELQCKIAVPEGPAGPVVRYLTSRHNYWICFEPGEPVRLVRRRQDKHVVLARMTGFCVEPGAVYLCRVSCSGSRITAAVENGKVNESMSVVDTAYAGGSIALRAEGPCRFSGIKVHASEEESAALRARENIKARSLERKRSSYPKAELIHGVGVPAEACEVRVQDVNGDGRAEFIACEVSVPERNYIKLARMTVMDWHGRVLWSFGAPERSEHAVHGAFAFNAADIDGDGRTEILLTRDFKMLVLDGETGEVKNSAPTPQAFLGREDNYERTMGDSMLVCNLRGLPSAQDFILKDRYKNLWAYTSDLKPLWHRHLNTGHYPRAFDINGDGKDEVMAGYSMLASDGTTLWTVQGGDPDYNRYPGSEHMDSVLIGRFRDGEDAPVEIAMAASDLGFILMDSDGTVKAQKRIGHAQSLSAGRFRPDLPGRQFAVRTLWGNQGIMNLLDEDGEMLLIKELLPDGGVFPVNWTGDGRTLFRFQSGLADGDFDRVVDLPSPAGVSTSPRSFDVNNDGVDEVFVIKDGTLEIYGPESRPSSPVPCPVQDLTNWNIYGGFIR